MKVAFISSGWPEYTLLLANALSELIEVDLHYPNGELGELAKFLNPSVHSYYYDPVSFRSPENLRVINRLCKTIFDRAPDVIHFQGNIFWYAPFWRRLSKYPTILTIHDPWLHRGEWRLSNWISLRLSLLLGDYFTVHGHRLRDYLIHRYRIKPSRVYSIPHGEFSIFRRWESSSTKEEENNVLFFGRIYPYKGLEVLVEAAPKVKSEIENVRFVVAGSRGGRYLQRLLPRMEDCGCFEIHHQYIPNELVAKLFQRASLVVLPYIDASQSGVIPVAFGFEKPVIATRVGSLSEVIEDGVSGLLVKPGDSLELAQSIIRVLKDSELRRSLAYSGWMKTQGELSWKNIATKFVEAYRQSINRSSSLKSNSQLL